MGAIEDFLSTRGGQATSDTFVSYVGSLLARYATGSQGSGRMAARGQAAAALKASQAQFLLQQQQAKVANAWADFARTNPLEEGFAVEVGDASMGAPPKELYTKLQKNQAALEMLTAKKQTKSVIRREKKVSQQIATRVSKLAPYTETRIAELHGANAGYWREHGAPAPLFLTQRSA